MADDTALFPTARLREGRRPRRRADETYNERMGRNWNDILQELRVTQTGTQILASCCTVSCSVGR